MDTIKKLEFKRRLLGICRRGIVSVIDKTQETLNIKYSELPPFLTRLNTSIWFKQADTGKELGRVRQQNSKKS